MKRFRDWLRRSSARVETAAVKFGLKYIYPFALICTPEGFYIVDDDGYDSLTRVALSPAEVSEYSMLALRTQIVDSNQARAAAEDRRFSELQRRLCQRFLDDIDAKAKLETVEFGAPVSLDRATFYADELKHGVDLLVAAIQWGWRGVEIERVGFGAPIEGYLATVQDVSRRQLLLPLRGIHRVTIYPRQAAVSYEGGPTIQLDLLEPTWR